MRLNFKNVEELVFTNESAQAVLPAYFSNYFESWRLSKRVPALKQLGKSAVLDFLNGLKEEHVSALESFFDEKIIVERLNYETVRNLKIPLEDTELCRCLCDLTGKNYVSMWRDKDHLYLSLWR